MNDTPTGYPPPLDAAVRERLWAPSPMKLRYVDVDLYDAVVAERDRLLEENKRLRTPHETDGNLGKG